MSLIRLQCCWCGISFKRRLILFKLNGPICYCGRKCASMGRRKRKTLAQKKAEKAAYDRRYRAINLQEIKRKKREYFQRTYDPEKAAIERKKRARWHVEYCRRYYADPKNHAGKVEYDRKRRDRIHFGAFAECYELIRKIDEEVASKMSDYEIRLQQGTLSKAAKRKKQLT